MKKYFSIPVMLLIAATSFSQSDSSRTSFSAGVTYHSGLNYYGRTDSLNSRGLLPFAGITFKSGLYLNGSVLFVANNQGSTYAATIAEGGYNFSNENDNWVGNVFITKNFYGPSIVLVQSAIKGSAGLNISNLNKILNVNLGADARLSDKVDAGAFGGLDHLFRMDNVGSGSLFIDPAGYAYAGTQNFTTTYMRKKYGLLLPAGEEQVTEEITRFNILSYEFSCPVIYAMKNWRVMVNPSYVIPQNVIEGEKASNLFYMTGTIRLTF